MPERGGTASYRPIPRDFDEMFIRLGWTSIEAHYAAHARNIAKWILLRDIERVKAGHEPLRVMRAAYVAKYGPAKNPARVDYVLRTVSKRKRMVAVTAEPNNLVGNEDGLHQ